MSDTRMKVDVPFELSHRFSLNRSMYRRRLFHLSVSGLALLIFVGISRASDPPSAVAPVMRLLKSGRVPTARREVIVEQIIRRGNEHDLAYIYEQVTETDAYEPEQKVRIYNQLADAAAERQVIPATDRTNLVDDIASAQAAASPELRLSAIRLAGIWRLAEAAESLRSLLTSPETPDDVRQACLHSLTRIGGSVAQQAILSLADPMNPVSVRSKAVSALASLDLPVAVEQAVGVLGAMSPDDDPTGIISAFLEIQAGSDQLAAAIAQSHISKEVAMHSLRHMYSLGRSDSRLSGVLGKIAGIEADPQPLTPEQVAVKLKEVEAYGDAGRGEDVFRRADLSCMKCHAVSKAGGQVGPDLSALGSSSPVDYIINSISNPDQQIKEAFVTRIVVTEQGLVHQGIVVDRTGDRLVLKEARGTTVTIPTASIDEEVEGKSLMPKGLMKFMTDSEFLDLVKFLSMLGKPGTEYAIRQTPRVQRWRVFASPPPELVGPLVDESVLEEYVLGDPKMVPAYSRVNGDLPLHELASENHPVLLLQVEVDVTQAGEVGFALDSSEGVHLWVGSRSSVEDQLTLSLTRGRHRIVLRVDTAARPSDVLRLELFRVEGSPAEFTVVDGA